MISLRSLLVSPEPSDPQDAEVAKHFIRDRKDAEKTARYWAETYAQDAKKRRTGLPPKRGETDPIKAAGLEEKHVKAFEAMVSVCVGRAAEGRGDCVVRRELVENRQ